MPELFKHLLVPLDFTAKNAAATEAALQMALPNRSRLTLLHVIERIEHIPDAELKDFYAMLEAKAKANLQRMASPFEDSGLDVRQEIIYGRRGPEIVRYAMENDVDLVVLSSHKVDLDQPTKTWGTLSYQVSILCQCPVLLVK